MDQNIEFEDYRYLNIGVDIDDIEILSKLHGILRPNKNHEPADFTLSLIHI